MSNEKLTLEHALIYLPHKVKVKKDDWGKIFTMDLDGTTLNCVGVDYVIHKQAKFILRPKTELETLIIKAYNSVGILNVSVSSYVNEQNEITGLLATYKAMGETFSDIVMSQNSFSECKVWLYNYLLSQHADLFNLIPKGLAVSIHDVSAQIGT